jgi:hypothetical protein
VTFGGSGRDGLGALRDADSFSSRRRLLLVDESAASAEAADASNAIWPKLEEVPPRLRCSGCELTLAALHARAANGGPATSAAFVDRRRSRNEGGARV